MTSRSYTIDLEKVVEPCSVADLEVRCSVEVAILRLWLHCYCLQDWSGMLIHLELVLIVAIRK
jgi:hypothetical protein